MKGVNKKVIEINEPESEYIEKVLVFLRQKDGHVNVARARQEAEGYVNTLVCWAAAAPEPAAEKAAARRRPVPAGHRRGGGGHPAALSARPPQPPGKRIFGHLFQAVEMPCESCYNVQYICMRAARGGKAPFAARSGRRRWNRHRTRSCTAKTQ